MHSRSHRSSSTRSVLADDMATVVKSTSVLASPDEVWAVLSDFAAISEWASNVDHSCLLSDQTEGVGTVRRIQTGRTTVVETVTRWEPGVALSYALTGLPTVIRSLTNTWTLEPLSDAITTSTTVALTTEIDAGSRPPQKGIAKAIGRKLGQASDEMLVGIAEQFKAQRDAQEADA